MVLKIKLSLKVETSSCPSSYSYEVLHGKVRKYYSRNGVSLLCNMAARTLKNRGLSNKSVFSALSVFSKTNLTLSNYRVSEKSGTNGKQVNHDTAV